MSTNTKMGLAGLLIVVMVIAFAFVLFDEPDVSSPQQEHSTNNPGETSDDMASVEKPQPLSTTTPVQEEHTVAEIVPVAEEGSVLVHGRILDTNGNPMEGVAIAETSTEQYTEYSPRDADWKDTGRKSGQDGRFDLTFPMFALPFTHLRFEHADFQLERASLCKTVPCYDGSFLLEDITLKPAYLIRGRVVDKRGVPVAGCRIDLGKIPWKKQENQEDDTLTDDDGRFTLKISYTYASRVWAYKEGAGVGWSPKVTPATGIEIPDVKIILERALPISGRLLLADGSPAPEKKLKAEGKIGEVSIYQSVSTEDQGGFLFDPLPEALYDIKTRRMKKPGIENAEDYGDLILAKDVTPGSKNLTFYLPMGSKVLIHLADEHGEPVQVEPRVHFMVETIRKSSRSYGSADWTGKVENPGPGTYGYGELPEGKYDIKVYTKGYEDHGIEGVEVPPPPGMVEVSAVLKGVWGGTILGKVLFADGRPAQGVVVQKEKVMKSSSSPWDREERDDGREKWFKAFTGDGIRKRSRGFGVNVNERVTVTDAEGAFCFENAKKGEHFLYLRVRGREVFKKASVQVSDENPRVELEIVLPHLSGSIEGVVKDGRGTHLPRACVVAWDGDELFNMTKSDEQGRYGFFGFPDGRYIVDARMITSAVSQGGSSGSGGSGKLEGLEEAFNAFIENGSAFHLDLTITDPWNSVVEVRVITSGSRTLPDGMGTSLSELNSNSENTKRAAAADLFKYNPSRKMRDQGPGLFKYIDLRAGNYKIKVSWDNPIARIQTGHFGYTTQDWEHHETFVLDPSTKKELTIHLPLADLQGTVVDQATAEPIPGVRMIIQQAVESEESRPIKFTLGDDGALYLKNVPAGTYHLTLLHEDYIPFCEKNFQHLDGMDRTGLRFALTRGTLTVNGTLKILENPNRRNYTGRRGPEWTVAPEITTLGADYDMGVDVAEDGSFQLKGLPPGEVKLVVFRYRSKVHEMTVTLPLPEGESLVIEVP